MGSQSGSFGDPISIDSDDDTSPSGTYGASFRGFVDLTSAPSPKQSPSGSYSANLKNFIEERPIKSLQHDGMTKLEELEDSKNLVYPRPQDPHILDVSTYEAYRSKPLSQSTHTQNAQTDGNVPGNALEFGGSVLASSHFAQRYKQNIDRSVSPRAQMVATAERASLQKDKLNEELMKADLEEKLRSIQTSMKIEHASSVQNLLREACKSDTKFLQDSISPFASIKAIDVFEPAHATQSSASSTSRSSSELRISQIYAEKSKAPLRTVHLNEIKPDLLAVPVYHHHVQISRNIHRPDDEQLHFEPYLGDADSDMEEFLEEFRHNFGYKEQHMETRDAERAMKANNHLDDMLQSVGITRQHLYKGLLDHAVPDDKKGSAYKFKNQAALRKALEKGFIESSPGLSILFRRAFNKVFGLELYIILLEHDYKLRSLFKTPNANSDALVHENGTSVSDNMSTYTALVCMICQTSVCSTHKVWDVEKKKFRLQWRSYEASIKQRDAVLAGKTTKSAYSGSEYCSEQCFLKKNRTDEHVVIWKPEDHTLLETILSGMPMEPRAACIVSMVMPRHPCWAIQRLISKIPKPPPKPEPMVMTKRLKWYDPIHKTLTGDWESKTITSIHEERDTVKGCQHEGPCDESNHDCSCAADEVLCEKLCACTSCPRKFTGCACTEKGKACSDTGCICVLLNRECDPDLCGSCGAVERADPQCQREISFFGSGCQNIHLQIADKIARKTIIGRTKIIDRDAKVGGSPYNFFGLYAAEDIPEGAFIDEYVGEIVSVDESNRWVKLFKRLNKSYIFDTNNCEVIDSQRMGNNTRFINHAEKSGTNTRAQLVLVNLVHRVKFFATKPIKAGSELYFYYSDDFFGDDTNKKKHIEENKMKKPTVKASLKRKRTSTRIEEESVIYDSEYMNRLSDEQRDKGTETETEVETRRTRSGRHGVKRYTR